MKLHLEELENGAYADFIKQFDTAYEKQLNSGAGHGEFSLAFYDIQKPLQDGVSYDELADTITRHYVGAPKHQDFDPNLPILNSYTSATEEEVLEAFPDTLQAADTGRENITALVDFFDKPRKVYSFNPGQDNHEDGAAFIIMDTEKAGVLCLTTTY